MSHGGGKAGKSKGNGNGNGRDKVLAASATAGIAVVVVCGSGDGVASPSLSAPIADERVNVRSWHMDTGCRYDLTSRGAIPPAHEMLIANVERSRTLSAADGYLLCDKIVVQQIGTAWENRSTPYFLANTLDVLSASSCYDSSQRTGRCVKCQRRMSLP